MASQLKQIHPLAWTIIVGTIFGRMATSMSIPFLSIYLTQQMGASPTQTGIIVAVSALVGVFASFYGGYISDRIGRKKVLFMSVFGWALVFIGFALSDEIWLFFIMNALNGICRALFEPTSRALLSDITPPSSKLLVFNLRYAAINLGVVFGPLLGLYLGLSDSNLSFLVAGGVYIAYGILLIVQFILHPLKQDGQSTGTTEPIRLKQAFRITSGDPVFMFVLIGTIFCVLGYGHFSSTLPQFMAINPNMTDGAKWFGYMLSLNAVVVLAVQFPVVRIASRFPPVVPLITGNIMVSVSLLLFGLAQSPWMLVAAVVIFTVGEVLMFTLMDVLVDRIAKPELKGTYFGMIGFNNLGNVSAPILGGFLLDSFGANQPMLVFAPIAISAVCGVPFLWIAHQRLQAREQQRTKENAMEN
ncbi:MFS transporter [Paenibacillus pabuli]|jgi:MFS family permease|uniref:MDR family MFS transporter n=1 Tax=Paenibacillus pabuli TaxID=1472 RepID=UPI00345B0CFE